LTEAVDALSAADILQGLPNRVDEIIVRHVDERPEHPAFVQDGRIWSYRAFSDAVDAVTAEVAHLQVRPGDRVLIASENSVALAALVFAGSRLNAWAIVANPRLSPRELDQIQAHSGARRILLATDISKEAADHATRLATERRTIGPFAGIGVGVLNETVQPEPVEPDPARQVAALMYTSGTTGQPSGFRFFWSRP
jgi:acyl-CoA synthetase (AMP-forming)/AMP-acid ligase II